MSTIEEIREYAELHSRGVLSDDEFTRLKNVAINRNAYGRSSNSTVIETTESDNVESDVNNKNAWMKSCGWIILTLSIIAFFASCETNKKIHEPLAGILAGLLNPVFFIGFPLSLYWLSRSGELSRFAGSEMGKLSISTSVLLVIPILAYYFGFVR